MIKDTDILFLSKENTDNLNKEDPLQAALFYTLTSDSNKEIVEKLMEFNLLTDLVKCTREKMEDCKEELSEDFMNTIRATISDYVATIDATNYIFLVDLLINIFLKENCLGPCFRNRTGDKEKQAFSEEQVEFLAIISPWKQENQLQDLLVVHFNKDGEDTYKNTNSLTIFLYLEVLLGLEITQFEVPESIKIWRARFHMLHNQLLTSNVCYLQDKSLEYYQAYLEKVEIEDKRIKAYLLIEYSNCALNFYKYTKAERALESAKELMGLKLNLTGKLGKRTKYQTFDIPQLVLNIESECVDEFIHPDVSPVDAIIEDDNRKLNKTKDQNEAEGEGEGDEENKIAHKDVNLDEENILLEKVQLKEEDTTFEASLPYQIYINSYVHYELKCQANTYDLQYEKMNAYLEKALEKSYNWLIFSMSLFLRSKNEQERLKTRERSMIQMQTLIDQFNDEDPPLGERSRYVYTNPYPLSWNLKRQLGFAYQSIGVFLSAFNLFDELDFYEDAAQCMVVSGKITQAEKYIDKVIEKYGETPQILCLLGDLKRKEEYYKKAWELSNHKNARSVRSLGMMQFQRGLVDEAIEYLKLALDINKLYPSTWYTLGCAYVKKEQYEKAIFAFGNVVSYDESHGEAWSNIATAYLQLGKLKEAQSCLEHAVKTCRHNWKIWENLILLYLQGNQFMRVVSSIKQLLRMNKIERINVHLMLKVSNCFITKYLSEGSGASEEAIERNKTVLFDLFDKILDQIPKDTGILKLYGRMVQSLEPDNYEKIMKLKLRETKSLQTAGWQYDLDQGQKITKSIDELKTIMGDKYEENEEVKCYVKNTLETIAQNKI